MNTSNLSGASTTIPASACRHTATVSGVDHIGPYVQCLTCRQRGRRHLHPAQILSFGPMSEPVSKRCPFCEAIAAGVRVGVKDSGSFMRVYIDGEHRGGISRIAGTERWLVQYRETMPETILECGAVNRVAEGIKMICDMSGVEITIDPPVTIPAP
jgi:hypothetical protein